MPSLESLTFDTSELSLEKNLVHECHSEEHERNYKVYERHWRTKEGDLVIVNYYDIPPDFPLDVRNINDLRRYYRESHAPVGMGVIEVEHVGGSERFWIRTIFKKPQNPGMVYVGAITIPFREFSFTVNCVCIEQGVTGAREAIVLPEWVSERRKQSEGSEETIQSLITREWAQDPYDPSFKTSVLRNVSESETYDDRFPNHPLSRLRRALNRIQPSILIAEEGAPFGIIPLKAWWRFW